MVKIKVCGITNLRDAVAACQFGADALGFVFYKGSPRYISPEDAASITINIPPLVSTVGVFVDETIENVQRIMKTANLDIAQLHGSESPEYCKSLRWVIKAFRIKEPGDITQLHRYEVAAYLLDTFVPDSFGGTGKPFDWEIARKASVLGPIILAGGLTPDNVQEAIKAARPYAVDVSSGVEAHKGIKDHNKLKLFIDRARSVSLD